LAVTDDGAVFVTNSESAVFAPVQVPHVFADDALVCVEIGEGRLYFVTASGKLFSYVTAKLFAAPWDRLPRSHLVSMDLTVREVSAASDRLYLRVGGSALPPINSAISPALLVGRTSPVQVPLESGTVLVDPMGAPAFGFMAGDIVRYADRPWAVVGAVKNSLVLMDCARQSFAEIEVESQRDAVFFLPLIGRLGGNLAEFDLSDGRKLSVDRSRAVMSRLSSFAPGDAILHPMFGRGEVLGARVGSLVLKYKCGIRLVHARDHEALMLAHTLTEREGKITIQVPTVDGAWVLVEQVPWKRIDPGSIVFSGKYGLGQFLGCAYEQLVVAFLRDGGAARCVKCNRALSVIRSKQSLYSGCVGVNQESLTVDYNENIAADLGYLPGDFIKIMGQCAWCYGTTYVADQPSLVFETDDMLLSNLGVGTFAIGPLRDGELIARIGAPGKRRMKRETGEFIDLSINTSDFINHPLMPLDRIFAGNRIAIVVGAANDQIYVQFEGTDSVQILPAEYALIFRRLAVPASRTIWCTAECKRVLLHADAYRGMVFRPGDVVEQDSEEYRVIGRLHKRTFLVQAMGSTEYSARVLAPCGMSIARVVHRASFFE
jgi:hypothetical protein